MIKKLALINDLCSVGRCSLSIQIPVVSALELSACPIPTAVLSNHTAFPHVSSTGLGEVMEERLEILSENNIHFDGILIGYLGDCTDLRALDAYLEAEKQRNPKLRIFLDPAMADHGRLYRGMTEEHIEAMRALCRKADLICPNLTEAAFLADFDYEGLKETLDRCTSDATRGMVMHALLSELHHLTPGQIIVTGVEALDEPESDAAAPVAAPDTLINVLSEQDGDLRFVKNSRTGDPRPGTGDLFSAIVAGLCLRGEALENATRRAADFVALCIHHSEEEQVPVVYGVQFEDILGAL